MQGMTEAVYQKVMKVPKLPEVIYVPEAPEEDIKQPSLKKNCLLINP